MAMPKLLKGDTWSQRTARKVMPLLVWCAEHERTISYGQLDEEVQNRGWGDHVLAVTYGHAAGTIGDALRRTEAELGVHIPPLNALIVNADNGIPGSGCDWYLQMFLDGKSSGELTDDERQAMAEETIRAVWEYPNWGKILHHYGMHRVDVGLGDGDIESLNTAKISGGWSDEPESKEHKALKEWVAGHPEILPLDVLLGDGICERVFPSADRPDVLFEHTSLSVTVEVKSIRSNDADLTRGIFQCIKYRALLRADLKIRGKKPTGYSFLVSEKRLPQSIQSVADLLGVRVIVVKSTGNNAYAVCD